MPPSAPEQLPSGDGTAAPSPSPSPSPAKRCTRCLSAYAPTPGQLMLCSAAPGPPPAGHVSPRICNDCVRRENNNQWTLGYECPGWTYGRHGYRSAPLVFSPRTPKPESLVGTYDVVYFAADQRFGPRIHRRAGGTLVLSPASDREDAALSSWRHSDIDADTDSDRSDSDSSGSQRTLQGIPQRMPHSMPRRGSGTGNLTCLRGDLTMDHRAAVSDSHAWVDGMTFYTYEAEEEGDGSKDGEGILYSGWENRSPPVGGNGAAAHGRLRVVAERCVSRSRPDARRRQTAESDGGGCRRRRRRDTRPVIFRSADEADRLAEVHRTSIAPTLAAGLGLPDLAAELICEFWKERPPPLFEFLPGDLCLSSTLPEKGFLNESISTVTVVRRRSYY